MLEEGESHLLSEREETQRAGRFFAGFAQSRADWGFSRGYLPVSCVLEIVIFLPPRSFVTLVPQSLQLLEILRERRERNLEMRMREKDGRADRETDKL